MKNLPKGLRVDRGYLQLRLTSDGFSHFESFGLDNEAGREIAIARLNELRKNLLLWKHKLLPSHPFQKEVAISYKKFNEVADIFIEKWVNQRSPDGLLKHTPASQYTCRLIINGTLKPFFGKKLFNAIKPVDVQEWRESRLKTVLGTSANREQGVLSSLFSHIETWVKTEQITGFALPSENPCKFVKKATSRKRERVLTSQELIVLKAACSAANDSDLWEICKMGLKSLLRKKDLMRLENGEVIDLNQAKTGVRIMLPIQVLRPLNYVNFRKRWEAARKSAGLFNCQFRDLRKTGANLLKMKGYSTKLVSEMLGHTSTDTTEIYLVKNAEHLRPLAVDLETIVENI